MKLTSKGKISSSERFAENPTCIFDVGFDSLRDGIMYLKILSDEFISYSAFSLELTSGFSLDG